MNDFTEPHVKSALLLLDVKHLLCEVLVAPKSRERGEKHLSLLEGLCTHAQSNSPMPVRVDSYGQMGSTKAIALSPSFSSLVKGHPLHLNIFV